MSVVWTGGVEGGGRGRFCEVSCVRDRFIGLLCGNSDSSLGDFHALNLGDVIICLSLNQMFFFINL